jgi:hypothetical protein
MRDIIQILLDDKCQVPIVSTKVKQNILSAYIEAAKIAGKEFDIAIETGTLYGETTLFLSDKISKVYTIEAFLPLFESAQELFKAKNNIHSLFGDSGIALGELLSKIEPGKKILFWLDAHFSGEGTGVSLDGSTCPTFQELNAITSVYGAKNCAVIVDDVRCFGDPAYSHYPSQEFVKEWGRMSGLKTNISSGMFHLVDPDIRRELCDAYGITY